MSKQCQENGLKEGHQGGTEVWSAQTELSASFLSHLQGVYLGADQYWSSVRIFHLQYHLTVVAVLKNNFRYCKESVVKRSELYSDNST